MPRVIKPSRYYGEKRRVNRSKIIYKNKYTRKEPIWKKIKTQRRSFVQRCPR